MDTTGQLAARGQKVEVLLVDPLELVLVVEAKDLVPVLGDLIMQEDLLPVKLEEMTLIQLEQVLVIPRGRQHLLLHQCLPKGIAPSCLLIAM